MIEPRDIEEAAAQLNVNDPAPYSVYVNGSYHCYSRTRARFVRWVLASIFGLSVSVYDHGSVGWYILQNSHERAAVANAAQALREAQDVAEARSASSGY